MKILFTNNSRRFAGKNTLRKGKGRRCKTRCEVMETVGAFLDYCEGK